jgi:hypothetical protein
MLTICTTGCYNNSHVRTQRILEPDERVISLSSNFNLGTDFDNYRSYRISQSGVSGLRLGISYLGYHRGYEQGVFLGLGNLGYSSSIILGHDIRKIVQREKNLLRYSLYSEINIIEADEERRWGEDISGTVFQLRPAVTTITSDKNNYYLGMHGIFGFGTIQSALYDNYYSSSGNWVEDIVKYSFTTTTLGIGFTAGHEQRLAGLIVQNQVDLSFFNLSNSLVEGQISQDNYDGFDPLKKSSMHLGLGMAVRLAPKRKYSGLKSRSLSANLPSKLRGENSYDPFSGKLIVKEKVMPVRFDPVSGEPIFELEEQQFDPLTGEPVETQEKLKFDPMTGLPINPLIPKDIDPERSFLTPQERINLITKGLKVNMLNGVGINADVIDVNQLGIVVQNLALGGTGKQTLKFDRINSLKFSSSSRGFSGAASGASLGIASGLVVPLGLSVFIGDPEYMFVSFFTVPLGVLIGGIYGYTVRDTYVMDFLTEAEELTPEQLLAHKQKTITLVTQFYLESGFPSNNIKLE